VDFTTVVVIFFVTGFFLLGTIVAFAFLGPTTTSFASIKHSKAFCLCTPSTMSAGFSPGLVLGCIGVVAAQKGLRMLR
jgi:hypothetical protein